MLTTVRIITGIIIVLGTLAGLALSPAARTEPLLLAQAGDVRQEDRRADRREDRQADRRQDRIDNPAEVRVPLPRGADGTIDIPALLASIEAKVNAGAREIQVRNDSLTQEEARALLLATDASQNLFARIAAALPSDGTPRHVTFRGAVDARLQRQPDGSLRLIVRDINVGDLTPEQRAQLATDLSQTTGFNRVRIRGVDAQGNRVRVEFRADKGLTRNEGGTARTAAQAAGDGRQGRDDRAERMVRNDRSDRGERGERIERLDRSGSSDRVERPERSGSSNSGRH